MELKEFIKAIKLEADAFELYWLEQHNIVPDQFPMKFTYLHDWLDQFDAFTNVTDKIIETYLDEEGIEVTIVEDENGKIFYCWDLEVPQDTVIEIRKIAKEQELQEWEVVNNILEEFLNDQ